MDKQKLTGFIEKYSLGNSIESVPWVIKNNTLTTDFVSEDRTLLGNITLNEFNLDDSEVNVPTEVIFGCAAVFKVPTKVFAVIVPP